MIFFQRTARVGDSRYHGQKNRGGFTFLELLATTVLLGIGVVSLLRVISVGIFADADVENASTALYLAQEQMEAVRDAGSYAAIDGLASSRANLGGAFADFDRQVTVAGDPKQVDVTVYWDVRGDEQSVHLVSLFANYDY